jgi:hypothetical protein
LLSATERDSHVIRPGWRQPAGRQAAISYRKLAEIERLLNDPDVPMQPSRVWMLLAEIAERSSASAVQPTGDREGRHRSRSEGAAGSR